MTQRFHSIVITVHTLIYSKQTKKKLVTVFCCVQFATEQFTQRKKTSRDSHDRKKAYICRPKYISMEEYYDEDFNSSELWSKLEKPEGEFDIITRTIGKSTKHEVYDEGELWDYIKQENLSSVLEYLLDDMRQNSGRKMSLSYCKFKYDAEEDEFVPCDYRLTVTGIYKEGVYKVTIDDEYALWLEDD